MVICISLSTHDGSCLPSYCRISAATSSEEREGLASTHHTQTCHTVGGMGDMFLARPLSWTRPA